MDPQNNQDTGVSNEQPFVAAATMPLPSQSASLATPPGQSMDSQNPPVPMQAPPLPMHAIPSPALPTTVPVHPVTNNAAAAPGAGSQTSAAQDLPAEAADTDVIEKEWVVKAKQVVAETVQDPYKQVRELNNIRADYMKKRYNKDIKLPDA